MGNNASSTPEPVNGGAVPERSVIRIVIQISPQNKDIPTHERVRTIVDTPDVIDKDWKELRNAPLTFVRARFPVEGSTLTAVLSATLYQHGQAAIGF